MESKVLPKCGQVRSMRRNEKHFYYELQLYVRNDFLRLHHLLTGGEIVFYSAAEFMDISLTDITEYVAVRDQLP